MEKPNPAETKNLYNMEQAVSINSFFDVLLGDEQVRLQITSRNGADAARIASVVMEHIEAYSKLRQTYPAPPPYVKPAEPTRVNIDDNGNEQPEIKTFTADRLSVSVTDGKVYAKVVGKPWTQYGVPVWPETLEAAGLDVTPGKEVPNIAGWRADYVMKTKPDGKTVPGKVIRLLPPK